MGKVKNLKTVDAEAVPPGCSYSHASKMAVFNNNKAGGCPPKWECFYDLVCVADDAEAALRAATEPASTSKGTREAKEEEPCPGN